MELIAGCEGFIQKALQKVEPGTKLYMIQLSPVKGNKRLLYISKVHLIEVMKDRSSKVLNEVKGVDGKFNLKQFSSMNAVMNKAVGLVEKETQKHFNITLFYTPEGKAELFKSKSHVKGTEGFTMTSIYLGNSIAGNELFGLFKWYTKKEIDYWYIEPIRQLRPGIRNTQYIYPDCDTLNGGIRQFCLHGEDLPFILNEKDTEVRIGNTKILRNQFRLQHYVLNGSEDYRVVKAEDDKVEVRWKRMPDAPDVDDNVNVEELIHRCGCKIIKPDDKEYKLRQRILNTVMSSRSLPGKKASLSDNIKERFFCDYCNILTVAYSSRRPSNSDLSKVDKELKAQKIDYKISCEETARDFYEIILLPIV